MKKKLIAICSALAMCITPIAVLVAPQLADAQWVEVGVRPPEPRVEVRPPAPSPDHVWVPGYWNWTGHEHVWVAGTWTRPRRAGWSWHEPVWREHGHGWRFHRGHWGR